MNCVFLRLARAARAAMAEGADGVQWNFSVSFLKLGSARVEMNMDDAVGRAGRSGSA